MGFYTNVFNARKLAQKLERTKACVMPARESDTEHVSAILKLSDYVFQHLFLPILQQGCVPTAYLDFDRIRDEDLELLSEALEQHEVLDFMCLADTFLEMNPTTTQKTTFI